MGDIVVDDAEQALAYSDLPGQCLCGSKKFRVSYLREYIADVDQGFSYEAIGSGLDPYEITCYQCGKVLYTERGS